MRYFLLLSLLLISYSSQALSLIQEEKDILCSNKKSEVFIHKKDRYFKTLSKKYNKKEFLDTAILGESSDGQYAVIQMTPKNTSSLIEGEKIDFKECHCKQVGDSKQCDQASASKNCSPIDSEITWSPEFIKFAGQTFSVKHYGVYPNDGTYFMAYSDDGTGIAIIDYGTNFSVIHGTHHKLICLYGK